MKITKHILSRVIFESQCILEEKCIGKKIHIVLWKYLRVSFLDVQKHFKTYVFLNSK